MDALDFRKNEKKDVGVSILDLVWFGMGVMGCLALSPDNLYVLNRCLLELLRSFSSAPPSSSSSSFISGNGGKK